MKNATFSRTELLELRTLWKAAYKAAASGKSYTIDGRTLTRQDLNDIRAQLKFIEDELDKLDGLGGVMIVRGRPRR